MNGPVVFKSLLMDWLAREPRGATSREAVTHFLDRYTKQHVSKSMSELEQAGQLVSVKEPFGVAVHQRRYFHPNHKPADNLLPIGAPPPKKGSVVSPQTRTLDPRAKVQGAMPEPIRCKPWEDNRLKPDFVRPHFGTMRPGQYDSDAADTWAARTVR